MAATFPTSPTNGQTAVVGGVSFVYDSTAGVWNQLQSASSTPTLTSPTINTSVSGTAIKDEDDMSSDSATALATQQSIKAYVDTSVSAVSTTSITQGDTSAAVSDSGSDGTFTVTADGNTEITVTDAGIQLGGSGARVNSILDEDAMGSDSATALATQQSIKAYADTKISSSAPANIYATTSDPTTNLTAGQIYFSTTSNVLRYYNGTSWGDVSAQLPTITSISGTIENGLSGTLTLTGTNFGTAQGTVHFTVSGTDTDVSVTPSSNTSISVSIPSAIYGQSVGTTVTVAFTNNGNSRSVGTDTTVASSAFSSILTSSMPHSGINVTEAGIRTETASFTGATDNGITTTGSGFGWHDGHEGSPNDWPAYIAVYIGGTYPSGKAVNKLKISVHGNCFGNFELQGSNNADTSGTFYNTGSWTSLTYNSSGSSYSTQNGGGGSSGNSDGTVLTFNYTNSTRYTHYRIWFKDNSQPGSSGSLTGWAAYGWEMTRA